MGALIWTLYLLADAPPADCAPPADAAAIWWLEPRELEAGESLPLDPMWTDRPWSFTPIPRECLSAVSSSAPQFVRASADGRRVEVAADAPGGLLVTLSATIGGQVITGHVRVIDRDATPLVGTWRQAAPLCTSARPPEPVRELKFTGDGRYSVTWTPFESYRDYWGTYTHEPRSGRFSASIEGGNHVPAVSDLEGEARVTDAGRLRLTGVFLGSPNDAAGPGDCEIEFER